MAPTNLSEKLFKPRFKYPETSTLVARSDRHSSPTVHSALEGDSAPCWYRIINRLMWLWRGIDPLEVEEVLSRIAVSTAERTDAQLLDTVVGYRGGNWIYEWSNQAMFWQKKAQEEPHAEKASEYWLKAANFYSIAGYPHIKGDALAEQAEVLGNKAFEQSAEGSSYKLKEFSLPVEGTKPIVGFVHLPNQGEAPFPAVLVCGGLDALQSDYHRLFRSYLAPLGIAMITIDMPSVGFSAHAKLTQDTSALHQQVLTRLDKIPWVNATRIAVFGIRFGGNVAVRLAYLEPRRIKAVACLGPIVHQMLTDSACQKRIPDMYMDVLASRIGMHYASDAALKVELNRYSLKMQGLLGRRTPVPMLSCYWDNDPFSPKEESRLIADSSPDGKVIAIPSKPLYGGYDKALKDICQWLKLKIE
ncbi:esterase FrsA [Rouxiella badensis]|uniref:esterase FrsA n=1 Tax=Rouxiella badensis TaxID=1646377 RepID=UPI0013EF16B5|nr:esterase FrsA [Rouxiella badensis]MCC3718985.1 esterase FrsA [Rouxiella badensis]MCC3729039.1 esterase FrsA [Rouxiella badensis]MCC3733572.1 esterase FrsA [Rouxiella badensis]MCC3740590.1 esterase FrsA [Rouxiella badensis]MCC3759774.1 esterase FrsA [Rouxiella badensis]